MTYTDTMEPSTIYLPGWEASGIPICLLSRNLELLWTSKSARDWAQGVFMDGKSLFQHLANPELIDYIKAGLDSLAPGERFEKEAPFAMPNGQRQSCLISACRISCTHNGSEASYIAVMYDTTSRSAMEGVMESSFDNFIQTTINLDNAMKEITKQRSILNKFRLKMIKELDVARTVQRAIIARDFPKEFTFDCYGVNRPSDQIGGDYLDVIRISPYHYGFIVADVSGHGVGPALITTMLRAWVHELFLKHRYLDEFFCELNKLVYETFSETGFYLTAFAMILDKNTGELHMSSAGHDAAIRVRETECTDVGASSAGRVIGALEDSTYNYETIQLAPGDLIIAYTDGISECRNTQSGFYGRDRMVACLATQRTKPVKAFIDGLLADLDEYAAGEKAHDDQTILALRWKTTAN